MRRTTQDPRSQTLHEKSLHSTLIGIAALAGIAIAADVATTAQTAGSALAERTATTVDAPWLGTASFAAETAGLEARDASRSGWAEGRAIHPAPGPIAVPAPELRPLSGEGPVFLVPPSLALPNASGGRAESARKAGTAESGARSEEIPPAPAPIAVQAPELHAATGEGLAFTGPVTLRRPPAPALPPVRP